MKTNKGFTLIELLAVIVILAIIALITVPVVINIINNAKKGAAEDSTYGVIEAAKLFWVSNQASASLDSGVTSITFEYSSGKWTVETPSDLEGELQISGTIPTAGSIAIENGEISVTGLKFGDYSCGNPSGKVSCTKSS